MIHTSEDTRAWACIMNAIIGTFIDMHTPGSHKTEGCQLAVKKLSLLTTVGCQGCYNYGAFL